MTPKYAQYDPATPRLCIAITVVKIKTGVMPNKLRRRLYLLLKPSRALIIQSVRIANVKKPNIMRLCRKLLIVKGASRSATVKETANVDFTIKSGKPCVIPNSSIKFVLMLYLHVLCVIQGVFNHE